MKYRALGSTGLVVAELGFGCGAGGGLLVRGRYPEMRRAVARALEVGINYFDTAPSYGKGQSEVNLGAVLRELGSYALVGSKVRLAPPDLPRIGAAIAASVEGSLKRLGRERLDLIQLHNHLRADADPREAGITPQDFDTILRAFGELRRQGKVRFWGITGLGETDWLRQAISAGGFHTVQAIYNLLNPSIGLPVPAGFPYQDYGQLLGPIASQGMGVIAIRVLAGGALSGIVDRHANADPNVEPLATGAYPADVARGRRLAWLMEESVVGSVVEAAFRFTLGRPEVSTALVGVSSLEQLEQAVEYARRGPLPAEVPARVLEP